MSDNRAAFASLTELACRAQGECYADIQRAVANCEENPDDDDCMNYATCDCLLGFLGVVEALEDGGDFLKLGEGVANKVLVSASNCR